MRLPKIVSFSAMLLFASVSAGQQSDPAAVVLLAGKLHTALASKDVEGALALWSAKSPQRDAVRKLLASESQLSEKTVGEPEISGDRARVWVDRDVAGKTTKLVLECVKEQGEWKLWKETPG